MICALACLCAKIHLVSFSVVSMTAEGIDDLLARVAARRKPKEIEDGGEARGAEMETAERVRDTDAVARRQLMILTLAGKPVWASGDRTDAALVPITGLVTAVVGFASAGGEAIRSARTRGGMRIVFLLRGELVLLAVGCASEASAYLARELEYLHQASCASTGRASESQSERAVFWRWPLPTRHCSGSSPAPCTACCANRPRTTSVSCSAAAST